MMGQQTRKQIFARRLVLAGLLLACVVPVLAGLYRGTTLLLEWSWLPRFVSGQTDNLPLFIHVIGAMLFYPLAAMQMLRRWRERYPRWHRLAGRVAVVSGLASALAGTWITFVHAEISGPILYVGRAVFGPLWAAFLLLGLNAIRRRDFSAHQAWMIRAFAVAMPAGTLVFISAPFFIYFGGVELPQTLDESIQSCAWIVHLAIAEVAIRGQRPGHHPNPLERKQHAFG